MARRIILIAVWSLAGVLAGAGVVALACSCLYGLDLRRCMTAHPVDMTVDFSTPTEFSTNLVLKYPYGYGYEVELLLPASIPSELQTTDGIAGLKMSCTVADPKTNAEYLVREYRGQSCTLSKTANGYSVGLPHYLPPLHPGRYLFTVRVEEGIPALAGVEQRLTLRYLIDFDVLGPFMGVAWAVMAFASAGVVVGFARGAARWKPEGALRNTSAE
jgi:hypothetical protein